MQVEPKNTIECINHLEIVKSVERTKMALIIAGGLVSIAVAIIFSMFSNINANALAISQKQIASEAKIVRLETQFENVLKSLERIEKKLDDIKP